jgi:hypothetical protein
MSAQRKLEMGEKVIGQWSNMSMTFGSFDKRHLFLRQGCTTSGYGGVLP